MKRFGILASALALTIVTASMASAQSADPARVRVVHASPDAPAVDIWVNDGKAFSIVPFKQISPYASLPGGSYGVKVVPAGATEPAVIDANLDLTGGTNYTVVATGKLEGISPLVLTDDSPMPAAGKAHVRFVHLSPDAPAVDIAVKDGPVLFSNIAFKGSGKYTPVDAGSYDLEARPAGSNTAALSVPDVTLDAGTIYTIYAVGLAGGQPALSAIVSQDAAMGMPAALPRTGGEPATPPYALILAGLAALVVGTTALRLGLRRA